MLQVKTYLDKSLIHGIGLFADEDIPKGQIIWRYHPPLDIDVSGYHDFSSTGNYFNLSELEREYVKKYAYYDAQLKKYILSGDNDRFTNHSENPNTAPKEDGDVISIMDIKKGEEITINYYKIDYLVREKI